MKKYENTNLKVSTSEIVTLIVFICFLSVTVFFFKSYNDVKDLFNIENTKVDFIIQAPSVEQVVEIAKLDHIDRIVPYYYRSVSVLTEKGNVSSNLFIIEKQEDLPYTTFSDTLLIEKISSETTNPLYISDDFSNNTKVKLGDSIEISLDGTNLKFIVSGIYKSDHRHVGGTLITISSPDVIGAMKSAKYTGAFIDSNNLSETGNFFSNVFVPMGDLRARDEFDNDDAYQTYLNTRSQSDTTKEAFVTSDYIKELSRRNNGKLFRFLMIAVGFAFAGYLLILLVMVARTNKYTKANVLRDIKDNFTINQETRMYKKYFLSFGFLVVLCNVIMIASAHYFGLIYAISVINILELIATILIFVMMGQTATNKLKKRYLIENEKYEKEKRDAQKNL